ncbi:2Fe-2S ferredoxin [Halorubrum sp. SS5]|nr:2Fe-2S ferredoxin [Halorubrum sp. SS5]
MDESRRIAGVEEVPEESTLLATLRPVDPETVDEGEGDLGEGEDGAPEVEAILTRAAGEVRAFRNYCQHWTDVRLDKDDGAFVRNGEVFCQTHGATFEADGGYCNFGPCEGAVLESVGVTVADGAVYLDDDAYKFVRLGPSAGKGDGGGSRIDFTGN